MTNFHIESLRILPSNFIYSLHMDIRLIIIVRLIFIMETQYISCEVGTEYFRII
jgi:hypothetical protein